MSKERELLKRWFNDIGIIQADIKLLRDTQELLAKPEQTEQEPVAWMLIDKETGARIPKAYKPEHGVNKDRWELYPLFASPPTREPFEPEERQRLSKAYSTRAEQVAFEEGIIFAEISYGIGVDDEHY